MTSAASLLKQIDIFFQFTPTQLELVANLCQEIAFAAEELVFPENSSSKELYVIVEGEVEILIQSAPGTNAQGGDRDSRVIARLGRGQSFGEVALVDEGLRSAAARAGRDGARLLMIPRDKLMLLCETYPQLGYRLMYNLAADLATKIRNTDLHLR